MSERAIVLGMPASGTSYVVAQMKREGWMPPPRYEGADRGFPTYESLRGRCINRAMLGGEWTPRRFDPRFRVQPVDLEILARAVRWVRDCDAQWPRWVWKNPESTLTFHSLWSMFQWDRVVGVYRHPLACMDSVRVDHAPTYPGNLKDTWLAWNGILLRHCTEFIRFGNGDGFDPSKVTHGSTHVPAWARNVWDALEARAAVPA